MNAAILRVCVMICQGRMNYRTFQLTLGTPVPTSLSAKEQAGARGRTYTAMCINPQQMLIVVPNCLDAASPSRKLGS